MPTLSKLTTVDSHVVQAVASRMLDDMPPFVGYFAYTGDRYRRLCGRSAAATARQMRGHCVASDAAP